MSDEDTRKAIRTKVEEYLRRYPRMASLVADICIVNHGDKEGFRLVLWYPHVAGKDDSRMLEVEPGCPPRIAVLTSSEQAAIFITAAAVAEQFADFDIHEASKGRYEYYLTPKK